LSGPLFFLLRRSLRPVSELLELSDSSPLESAPDDSPDDSSLLWLSSLLTLLLLLLVSSRLFALPCLVPFFLLLLAVALPLRFLFPSAVGSSVRSASWSFLFLGCFLFALGPSFSPSCCLRPRNNATISKERDIM